MLVATGRLVQEGDRVVPTSELRAADLATLEVPPTLHALVASRLDALPPADRALLQDAAVLGQTFTLDALAAMAGEPVAALEPRLASLVRREILTVETDPRAPTRGQHGFVQALLREVAYSTLARRDRRARHLTAARYFESLDDDEIAGVVASHFVAAYHAAPEGPEGEAVATQARIALLATAERAQALGALGQATEALTSALEVSRDPADRARLLERAGWLCALDSRYEQAQETLTAAQEAYAEIGDRVSVIRTVGYRVEAHLGSARIGSAVEVGQPFRAEGEALYDAVAQGDTSLPPGAAEAAALFAEAIGRTAFRSQEAEDAIRWADRALALAERLRLDHIFLMALVTKSTAMMYGGHRREGRALLEGTVLDARAHGYHEAALRGGVNLASGTTESDPRASLEWTKEGMALARRLGLRSYDGYHAGNGSGAAERLGDWAWCRDAIGEMLEMDPERFEAEWLAACRDTPTAWTGDPDLARGERLLAGAIRDVDFQTELNASGWLARCAFADGRFDDAVRYGEAFFRRADPSGGMIDFAMIGRFALHAGKVDAAQRVLELVGRGPGDAGDHDLEGLRAGIAAAEGRTADAAEPYRAALAGYRAYGLRFDYALTILDMANLIGSIEPAVRAVIPEGREILAGLGARPLVERLDALVAASGAEPAGHGLGPGRGTSGSAQPPPRSATRGAASGA